MTSTRDGRFDMNAISDVVTVNRLARAIEDQEARRLGIPVPLARVRVANRIGASSARVRTFLAKPAQAASPRTDSRITG